MGALAEVAYDGSMRIRGFVSDLEGRRFFEATEEGHALEAEEVGRRLAEKLLKSGAAEILSELRGS